MVLAGLTIANIVGVPFGTFVGQQLGWRASFGAITVLGILSLIGILRFIPVIRQDEPPRLVQELRSLIQPQVLLMYFAGAFSCASLFAMFTYITPALETITGFAEHQITYILILFGFGVTLGNIVGGKLADWKLLPSVLAMLGGLALLLALLSVALKNPFFAVATIFLWGVAAFGAFPGIQVRILNLAREAPLLAATSAHSVLNIGNAGGAYLGGLAITYSGLSALPWLASALALIGLAGATISYITSRRQPTAADTVSQAS